MSTFSMIKVGAHVVSALGVTKVLGDIVRNNTNIVTTYDKVLVNAGSLVLGSMIVQKASDHVTAVLAGVQAKIENQQTEDESDQK